MSSSMSGYNESMILGVDEVGRGPWAGPLVVGAVVLGGTKIEGLTDSKKLSKKRREELAELIYQHAAGIGIGWVHAQELDAIGLSEALKLATIRAVGQVSTPYHEIIIDGTVNFLKGTNKGEYVTTLKKADLLIPSVSAASIIAKVARDIYMEEQDVLYPHYGFKRHVGYGTAIHRAAIEELGVTPLHRLSFAPLAKYRLDQKSEDVFESHTITTKQIGDTAEDMATKYLALLGHQIVERNWKTKYCEIDIVSVFDDTVYFTEVKYRKSPDQGGGMAAITKKKLNQMKFAAKLYASAKKLHDTDMQLAVISLSGKPPVVETFLELTEG
jgi:ribonuclease HII